MASPLRRKPRQRIGASQGDGKVGAVVAYVFFLCNFFGVSFVGLIMAWVLKAGPISVPREHYAFLWRIFWVGLLWMLVWVIAPFFFFASVEFFYMMIAIWFIWWYVRIIIGFVCLLKNNSPPNFRWL